MPKKASSQRARDSRSGAGIRPDSGDEFWVRERTGTQRVPNLAWRSRKLAPCGSAVGALCAGRTPGRCAAAFDLRGVTIGRLMLLSGPLTSSRSSQAANWDQGEDYGTNESV